MRVMRYERIMRLNMRVMSCEVHLITDVELELNLLTIVIVATAHKFK